MSQLPTPGVLIDHCTYVADSTETDQVLQSWRLLGFEEITRLTTVRYPATHIALATGASPTHPWITMTGLSVSTDPASAINHFLDRYGPGVQHVAYHVAATMPLDEVYGALERAGRTPMTPIFDEVDQRGARLRQFFLPPEVPYGPFTEFIQRHPGDDGALHSGFDVESIDQLYDCYTEHSRRLDRLPARSRR